MKVSGVDKGIGTYKTYISLFQFLWPEVRPIMRPDHYNTMGKCSNDFFFWKYLLIEICYLSQGILILGHFRLSICSFGPMTTPLGYSRSYEVKFVFCLYFLIEYRARVLEVAQSVSIAKTHRLICNMTSLGEHVTSRDLDRGQIQTLTF